MTKHKSQEIDNLYNFSHTPKEQQYNQNTNKKKEREKRIKQKNELKDQFDFDTEVVMGMTNKNNENKRREEQIKLTRKQEKILKKKKRIKRIIKWTTLFLLVAGGVVFALVSPIFNISEINVLNNKQISSETVISLSQLQTGQNLFKFSIANVSKEIKTNSYVENVKIKRRIPDKVEIIIQEREKDYNVEFLNGYAYINKQGYILEISEQKIELPVIQGISTDSEQVIAGNRLNSQDLDKLEVVIQIMNICKNYGLEQKVSSINVSDKNNYIIYMDIEKKSIYLGDENNLSNKMLYIPTILEENKEKEGDIYIDKDSVNKFKARFREKV